MRPYFKIQKSIWILFLVLMLSTVGVAQESQDKWKLQLALGVNKPLSTAGHPGYFSEIINFPTINLGVQHMFTNTFGAKLDLGYNRSSEREGSLPFTLNYTRVNVQAVYNFKDLLTFLPRRISIVGHAGPGVTMTKPLDSASENTYTYPNGLLGFELHYQLSRTLSIYGDAGYALSFANGYKYNVAANGYSFNGDLAYVAVGVSVSLSGSNYCF